MRTVNAMQLKARIKNRARQADIPTQMMMQNYLFERVLERLSMSPWRDKVILKGGILISSLVGVASRTTMDLDATVRGFTLTHESAKQVFAEIVAIETDDDWEFSVVRTEDIRETDDYPGIRVHLLAAYPPMMVPLTIDVTTGDRITPDAIEYGYRLLFDDRSIPLMAYPLETVLAEKLETVITRGVENTRPRDFYDIHTLWAIKGGECDVENLRRALSATSEKRRSAAAVSQWRRVLADVAVDDAIAGQWSVYVRKNPYASKTTLEEACRTAETIMSLLD